MSDLTLEQIRVLSNEQIRDELNIILNIIVDLYNDLSNMNIVINDFNDIDRIRMQINSNINRSEEVMVLLAKLDTNDMTRTINSIINEDDEENEINLFNYCHELLKNIEHSVEEKLNTIGIQQEAIMKIGQPKNIPEDENELKTLNEQIINESTCSICLVRVVNTKIDCGHLYCIYCILNLNECPRCRTPINYLDKIYLKKYLFYKNKYLKLKKKLHNKI